MTFFSLPLQIVVFSLLFHNKIPCFSLNFSFSPLKNSNDLFFFLVLNTKYTYFFTFSLSPYIHHCKTPFHHCTFSFITAHFRSSLHIFVHPCTFCALLHVKTALHKYLYNIFSPLLADVSGTGQESLVLFNLCIFSNIH